jgi:transposase-like protein
VTTRAPRRLLTPVERREMVRRYVQEKKSIRQVAAEMNRSYFSVWKVLDDRKVPRTSQGSRRPAQRAALFVGPVERDTIVRMYRDELRPLREICQKLHRGQRTICRVLGEENVQIRSKAARP